MITEIDSIDNLLIKKVICKNYALKHTDGDKNNAHLHFFFLQVATTGKESFTFQEQGQYLLREHHITVECTVHLQNIGVLTKNHHWLPQMRQRVLPPSYQNPVCHQSPAGIQRLLLVDGQQQLQRNSRRFLMSSGADAGTLVPRSETDLSGSTLRSLLWKDLCHQPPLHPHPRFSKYIFVVNVYSCSWCECCGSFSFDMVFGAKQNEKKNGRSQSEF